MNGQWKLRGALALASLFGVNAAGQSITNFTATTKPPSSSMDLRALSSTPCFTNLTVLEQMEQLVTNIEVVRDYVLCADTIFTTGLLTTNGDILLGEMPLTLRKNMHIHCGEIGGSSDNNCIIRGGSFGVVSFENNFEETTVNDNVLVQGVTFQDIALYGMLLGLPGNFRFVDCIFVDHVAERAPVLIEWMGGSLESEDARERKLDSPELGRYAYLPREQSHSKKVTNDEEESRRKLQASTTLNVEFTACTFKNCVCSAAPTSFLSLASLRGDGVNVTFITTLFENNDFNVAGINDAFAYGAIVEIFDNGHLHFDSSCFILNKAHGNGLVASYGTELPTAVNAFGGANVVDYRAALECEFVALVDDSDASFPNIDCADFNAEMCAFFTPNQWPEVETTSPSQIEAEPGVSSPSNVPTSGVLAFLMVRHVWSGVIAAVAATMALSLC
jgi:hypothetical protein